MTAPATSIATATRTPRPERFFSLSRLKRALLLPAAALTLGLAGCTSLPQAPGASQPTGPVAVDLPRYMGRWYVIANVPYFAEKGMVGSRSEWILRSDGITIDDHYYGRSKRFDAPEEHHQFLDTVVEGSGGGEWSVKLWGPIHARQVTLWVDPQYRYTLVGVRGTKWGWVFSREPLMDDATYQSLLKRFAALGYDASSFRRVPQRPEDIGQPGFQNPND
ncbi:lipocalin family protein [Amphibiibacter pelophylacis]|uniref:Lipocalin family protein n=1 Tax=Amphibiibacter pelophylacis TaxID=1799477 RepID=A0ACC6P125_9BURK